MSSFLAFLAVKAEVYVIVRGKAFENMQKIFSFAGTIFSSNNNGVEVIELGFFKLL